MKENILYCVLNWGLGHASRSIPIIEELIQDENNVMIASDGLALSLLRKSFPTLKAIELPGYNIKYRFDSISLNILHQARKFIKARNKEKKRITELVDEFKIQKIISDNRFGCFDAKCTNIFITHQIRLIHTSKVIKALGSRMNIKFIENFHECWVPDYPDNKGLTGEMSHDISLKIPIKYIGFKSRFSKIPKVDNPKYKSLTILSGPEPQRSKLEAIIMDQLINIDGQHALISGKNFTQKSIGKIDIFGLLDEKEMSKLIRESNNIISRSGYSSIMDYEAMERKAILIPTPGQTEQVYLAKKAFDMGRHLIQFQNRINLQEILS